jgi:hypothetical protein
MFVLILAALFVIGTLANSPCDIVPDGTLITPAGESSKFHISAYNVTLATWSTTDLLSGLWAPAAYTLRIHVDPNTTLYLFENADECISVNETMYSPTNHFYFTLSCHNVFFACTSELVHYWAGCDLTQCLPGMCGANGCGGVCSICEGECGVDGYCTDAAPTQSQSPSSLPDQGGSSGRSSETGWAALSSEARAGAVFAIVAAITGGIAAAVYAYRRSQAQGWSKQQMNALA